MGALAHEVGLDEQIWRVPALGTRRRAALAGGSLVAVFFLFGLAVSLLAPAPRPERPAVLDCGVGWRAEPACAAVAPDALEARLSPEVVGDLAWLYRAELFGEPHRLRIHWPRRIDADRVGPWDRPVVDLVYGFAVPAAVGEDPSALERHTPWLTDAQRQAVVDASARRHQFNHREWAYEVLYRADLLREDSAIEAMALRPDWPASLPIEAATFDLDAVRPQLEALFGPPEQALQAHSGRMSLRPRERLITDQFRTDVLLRATMAEDALWSAALAPTRDAWLRDETAWEQAVTVRPLVRNGAIGMGLAAWTLLAAFLAFLSRPIVVRLRTRELEIDGLRIPLDAVERVSVEGSRVAVTVAGTPVVTRAMEGAWPLQIAAAVDAVPRQKESAADRQARRALSGLVRER